MGIRINNNFDLLDEQDDGYIVDDRFVRGGYKVATSNVERDAIPLAARKMGMSVFVNDHQTEYQLIGGVTNSSWQEKTLTDIELPAYAKLDNSAFTGLLSSTWEDIRLESALTTVETQYNGDSEKDLIVIPLVLADLQYIGELSIVQGENSGATAIVVVATSRGLIIPSKTAVVSKKEHRSGEFIKGERLILKAGPALARRPQDVMTRIAVESLTITKYGGSCYGHISNWSALPYTLESVVTSVVEHNALGIMEVKIALTDSDISQIHSNMKLKNPRGEEFTTLRVTRDKRGILIKSSDRSKIQIGDRYKVIDSVLVPTKKEHLSSKQYVDDMTGRIALTINANFFTPNGATTDPLDGQSRELYTFTIPSSLYSARWPQVDIYKVIVNAASTDYLKISSSVYRYVIRETEDGSDIIIQVWDAVPSTVSVIIH